MTPHHTIESHRDKTTPILVIGATGKTGRRVSARLAARGHTVRAASRSSRTAFDWDRSETWAPALEGVRTAYVTYQPDLSLPSAAVALSGLVERAVEARVERFVLLSGRGEEGARECEDIVLATLPQSTVLTSAWFSQNFSEGMMRDVVMSGTIALPVEPSMTEPFLDADDIADAAVAALLDVGSHRGCRYELTGPESLTFGQVAAAIGQALGRHVEFVPVGRDEFVAGAVEGGVHRRGDDACGHVHGGYGRT